MPPTRKRRILRILAATAILLLTPFVAVLALLGWGWSQECISNRLSVVDVRPLNPRDIGEHEQIHVRISLRNGGVYRLLWEGRPERGVTSKFGFYLPLSVGQYVVETRLSSGAEPRITRHGSVHRYAGLEDFIVIGENGDSHFQRWRADTYTSSYFRGMPYSRNRVVMGLDLLSCVEKLAE